MTRVNIASKKKLIKATEQYKVVILGAGNVSTHISRHLYLAGHQISCVWSRSMEKSRRVAAISESVAVEDAGNIPGDADFYLMAVSDDAIAELATKFSGSKGIWLHTAGSVSIEVLKGSFEHFGVIYPLQTLSSERELSLADTPLLVEGNSAEGIQKIQNLASSISNRVVKMTSHDRQLLHLAAVFANNFTSHIFNIVKKIIEEKGGDFSLLGPLIHETFLKATASAAPVSQTGPAARGDQVTIEKHLQLLKGHPEWEKLYTFMSRSIQSPGKTSIDPITGNDQF